MRENPDCNLSYRKLLVANYLVNGNDFKIMLTLKTFFFCKKWKENTKEHIIELPVRLDTKGNIFKKP